MNKIGENICRFRKTRGWSQEKFAERLSEFLSIAKKDVNYTNKTISKWENGDCYPPMEVILGLSKMMGVSIDEMLSEEINVFSKAMPERRESAHSDYVLDVLIKLVSSNNLKMEVSEDGSVYYWTNCSQVATIGYDKEVNKFYLDIYDDRNKAFDEARSMGFLYKAVERMKTADEYFWDEEPVKLPDWWEEDEEYKKHLEDYGLDRMQLPINAKCCEEKNYLSLFVESVNKIIKEHPFWEQRKRGNVYRMAKSFTTQDVVDLLNEHLFTFESEMEKNTRIKISFGMGPNTDKLMFVINYTIFYHMGMNELSNYIMSLVNQYAKRDLQKKLNKITFEKEDLSFRMLDGSEYDLYISDDTENRFTKVEKERHKLSFIIEKKKY